MRHRDRRAGRDPTGNATVPFLLPATSILRAPSDRLDRPLAFPGAPRALRCLPSLPQLFRVSFTSLGSGPVSPSLRPRPGSRAAPPRPRSSPGASSGQDRTIHLHSFLSRLQAGTGQHCDRSVKVCLSTWNEAKSCPRTKRCSPSQAKAAPKRRGGVLCWH